MARAGAGAAGAVIPMLPGEPARMAAASGWLPLGATSRTMSWSDS
jgi:hypothetical protein